MDGARATDKLLVAALLVTLVLWNVPYGWVALYPFKIFATWLHESSHALVMLATGAGLDRLEIFRDTSGLAYPAHGVTPAAQVAISSAGYMGTAFFGAVFLLLGRTERGARWVLAGVGAAMGGMVAVGVRNPFGIAAVCAIGATLLVVARWGSEGLAAFLVNLLAAQSCINAVLDIRILFGSTLYVDGQPRPVSDADTVARVLGGPAALWASLWLLWSFALFYVALRFVRQPARRAVVATAA
jgi:hypothetical protein